MIRATCTACQIAHNYSHNLAGYSVVCPKCGHLLDLPHPSVAEPVTVGKQGSGYIPVGRPLLAAPKSEMPQTPTDHSDVPFDAPHADRRSRLAAWFLDVAATILALLPTVWMANSLRAQGTFGPVSGLPSDEAALKHLLVAFSGLIAWFVWNVFLITVRGQTFGKILLGIRIVRNEDSGPAGFFRGFFIRDFLSSCLALIPGYWILDRVWILGCEKRCLRDHLGGTKVILL
jgi:uncharacterized RDD family membrane protein YckC